MTITVKGDGDNLAQVISQCSKLVDVVACREHAESEVVSRELALVKLAVDSSRREEVLRLAAPFNAQAVDLSGKALVLEATGTPEKLDDLVALLRDYGIIELIRTGKVIAARGDKPT